MTRRSGPSDIFRYSHLGIQFAVVVLAAIWAGNQLDRRLGSKYFTLVGTFVGAGIGFYFLYREIYRARPGDSGSPPDSGHSRRGGGRDARSGGDPGDGPPAA